MTEVVEDLIGGTPIAVRNTEETFHFTDREVGHAPGANLPRRAQTFERRHSVGEIGVSTWPVQQVEIEMISAETGQARVAGLRDAVARRVIGRHFGDQEYAIAPTGNRAADQFLGAAAAVTLRRVDQIHAERQARAQRFFLSGLRTSS